MSPPKLAIKRNLPPTISFLVCEFVRFITISLQKSNFPILPPLVSLQYSSTAAINSESARVDQVPVFLLPCRQVSTVPGTANSRGGKFKGEKSK